MSVRVGDIVLYTPNCFGDRCEHPASDDRPAMIVWLSDDGSRRASLAVFHPSSTAHLYEIPFDPNGGPRTWRERDPA